MDSADRIEAALETLNDAHFNPGVLQQSRVDPDDLVSDAIATLRSALSTPPEQSGLAGELENIIINIVGTVKAHCENIEEFLEPEDQANFDYWETEAFRILTALTADKARDEALEEAAKVAEGEKYTKAFSDASYSAGDEKPQIYNDACDDIAQAIRSLKGAAK